MNPRWHNIVKEYAEALIIALILALIIRAFVVQAFKIPSGSMLETLQIGDHLLVNKFIYGVRLPVTVKLKDNANGLWDMLEFPMGPELIHLGTPQRGDIIVFEFPEDKSKDFIKRIIGVPGDVIEIRDKQVIRNGEVLKEPYIRHTDMNIIPKRDTMAPTTVPQGKYFVMGDNRDESYDSRFWGFVDGDVIKGKAWVIYWSSQGLSTVRWDRIGNVIH